MAFLLMSLQSNTVFGFEHYTNTVCGFVNGTDPKFTIAVYGKRGVGKKYVTEKH